MGRYSGKFQYTGDKVENPNQGPCQVTFDQETFVITPSSGAPLAFDLGDVDSLTSGEWELQLTLYNGPIIILRQFGAAFSNMGGELLAAWRDRIVQCLLLEDLEEVGRYRGMANDAPGEIRIYRSNIAFLPDAGLPLQWRLAEVESIEFDNADYSIVLSRGGDRLVLSKFAKKTDEVLGRLRETLASLRDKAAAALHDVFPFLSAGQLARLLPVLPEGHSASLALLNEVHPQLGSTLIDRAVDETLIPYFNALRSRATDEPLMAGFKFIRADEGENDQRIAETPEQKSPLFFWFFFPLPNQIAAWESTTGTGRATYFFRAPSPFPTSVESLTRGLALVNFRREPVYLPDESLDRQSRFHRYAIGARKLPDLRSVRAAYVGRAIHSSPEEWLTQMEALLARPQGA